MAEPKPVTNILQLVFDNLAAAERSLQPLGRICLVGRFEQGAAKGAFEKSCRDTFGEFVGEKAVTGLLLIFPTGWIQLVEGIHESLTIFLRSVTKQLGNMHEGVKVIHSAEDVPKRHFQSWNAKDVNAVRNNYAEVDAKTLPGMLGDTAIGMLKLAAGLGSMGSEMSKLDRWADHFPDMPSNERIGQLIDIDEVPSLEEFFSIFCNPVDLTMEADRVWPPERAMVY